MGEGDSSLFKWRAPLFLRGDNFKIVEIHWRNFKIFFSRTTGPISTKFSTKHPLVKGIQVCSNEEPFNSHKVNNAWVFPSHNQHYDNHMCLLIWTVFSGERCGPWTSCFYYVPNVSVSRARFAAILNKLISFFIRFNPSKHNRSLGRERGHLLFSYLSSNL